MFFAKLILFCLFLFIGRNLCINKKTNDKLFWIGFILGLSILFYYCFNIFLNTNGDNCVYLMLGKSLAIKKGAFLIGLPGESADSYYPLGLPFLISIIYTILGMNVVAVKILIFLFYCGFVFIYYKILVRLFNKNISFLTTIVFSSSPFLVEYASIIMTEIPFIFFSLLSCYLAMTYFEKERIGKVNLFFLLLSCFMTYMVRAVGIIIFPTIVLYFVVNSGDIYSIKKIKIFLKSLYFKKIFNFVFLFLVIFVLWQIRGKSAAGSSQLDMFLNRGFFSIFLSSLKPLLIALPHTLVCHKSIFWSYLETNYTIVIFFNLLLFYGLIMTLKRNMLVVLYFVFLVLIYLVATPHTLVLVLMRFMLPTIPFTLIIFVVCMSHLGGIFFKKEILKNSLILIFLFAILIINFNGLNIVEKRAKEENQSPMSFIECNKWLIGKVSEESVIISRKDAYTYIVTGAKAHNITCNPSKIYNKKWGMEQLKHMKKIGADYLILDTFSGSSVVNIYPLVNEYRQYFRLIKVFDGQGPTYLFKIENLHLI